MKKAFSLWVLILVICAAACPSGMAECTVDGWIYYGDYAYTMENGQATIVGCRGGCCNPDWDDEASGLQDRPGKSDVTATYTKDSDGQWRAAVPDRLGGYPVVSIGDYGFSECYASDIILPEGLTGIGERAFAMCEYTHAITVPESVTFIGENAFDDECYATLRVTQGSYAARYAEENGLPYTYDPEYKVIQSRNWLYTLTDGLVTICGYDAWDDYENDDYAGNPIDIEVPAQLDGYLVTAIKFRGYPYPFTADDPMPSETIYGSVTIPDSVTEIGGNPFRGIFFSSFNVSPNHSVYETVDGVLFDKQQKKLIAYPGARTDSYVVPEGTMSIGENAFDGCAGLTGVTLPDSVTSIGKSAFFECDGLTSVNIPSGVTSIDESAFAYCRSLIGVSIPDGVTSIGDEAFYYCGSLTSVTLPGSVTEITGNPFQGCGLTRFVVSPDPLVYEAVDGVLYDKQQKKLIAYPCARTGDYVMLEGTEAIGDGAFSWCEGLTGVSIPDSVTSIGDYAFSWCEGLTSVAIPSGVTSIGDGVFLRCGSLTGVTIPSSMTSIGDEAYYWFKSLTSVTIPPSVTSIGDHAFALCHGLTSVTIPPSVTSIGEEAFYYCERLTSVTIPPSVTSIGEAAFERGDSPVVLSVTEGSFAEQYAKENGFPFVCTAAMAEE